MKNFAVLVRSIMVERDTLRHTTATVAIRAGEHIVAVSKRLGHAQASITSEIYTHYIPGDDEDIAANWEKQFSKLQAPE